jgi:diguanylate cyclase (GGDEF)-like protein/PAS domain S-box-containing protein
MNTLVAADPAQDQRSALEREHEDLLQFIYVSPIGLIEVAADGTIGLVNPHAMQLLLQIVEARAVTNFFAIMEGFAPELRNMVEAHAAPNGVVCENHRIFIGPHPETRIEDPKVLNCTLVKLSASRFIASLSDVSRQVAHERRLKQAETWFASLLDEANDFAVIALDDTGNIIGANESMIRQTGFKVADVVGKNLEIFEVRDTAAPSPDTAEKLATARRNGWYLEEGWHKTWGGNRYWCQMLIAVRGDEHKQPFMPMAGYTVVLRQVRRHELNTDKLRQMLTTDHLTGAANRAHFFDTAERECLRAIRYGQPLSLIALDIDHFKQVNDRFGHAAGDAALRAIVQICMQLLRSIDLLARLGGEEFVILLPASDLSGATMLAERIRDAIASADIKVPGAAALRCTASFGCATLEGALGTLASLLSRADAALYDAKHAGRNRVVPRPGRLAA